jgi:hypothetical protein
MFSLNIPPPEATSLSLFFLFEQNNLQTKLQNIENELKNSEKRASKAEEKSDVFTD